MRAGDRPMMLAKAVLQPGPHFRCGAPLGPCKPHLPHVLTIRAKRRATQPTPPARIDLGSFLMGSPRRRQPLGSVCALQNMEGLAPGTLGLAGFALWEL